MKKQQIQIKLIFPILLLSALVFTACTDDKEININPVQEEIKGFKISPEEACSELEDFLNARNRSWTTRGTMRQRGTLSIVIGDGMASQMDIISITYLI